MNAPCAASKFGIAGFTGALRGKGRIVFPLHAKLLRLTMRFLTGVMGFVDGVMAGKFRSLRSGE